MNKGKFNIKTIVYIVIAVLALLLPLIISDEYFRMIFDQTLVYIVVALGMNFITGMTGQMNLATGGMMALGAYVTGILSTKMHVSVWICLILAVVAGYVVGVGLGYPSLRLRGVYLALTTIGFNEIIRLLATNMAGLTGGTQGIQHIPNFSLFGLQFNTNLSNYYFLFVVMLVMLFISIKIVYSKWGRAFIAIRDNVDAVESCGINIADLKIKAFTLASIYGCVGGVLFATLLGYINPSTFNLDLSFNFVIMMMLGGMGTIPGSIIGASVVTILPELLRFMQDYYWIIFCAIVMVFSVILPNGLVSLGGIVTGLIKGKKEQKGGNDIADDTAAR